MEKPEEESFQNTVNRFLTRHGSILDSITKFQEASSRVNRAVAKSVTSCGCLKISAEKQKIPQNIKLQDMKKFMKSHVTGNLCSVCQEVIQTEIGTSLFYIAAICSILNLNLSEVMKQEKDRISALGIYSLT